MLLAGAECRSEGDPGPGSCAKPKEPAAAAGDLRTVDLSARLLVHVQLDKKRTREAATAVRLTTRAVVFASECPLARLV